MAYHAQNWPFSPFNANEQFGRNWFDSELQALILCMNFLQLICLLLQTTPTQFVVV
jgi:hypothetical protein